MNIAPSLFSTASQQQMPKKSMDFTFRVKHCDKKFFFVVQKFFLFFDKITNKFKQRWNFSEKNCIVVYKKSMQEKFSFEEMNLFPLSGKAVLKHNLAEEEVK